MDNGPDDPRCAVACCCWRRVRSCSLGAIALARSSAVTGHGDASGDADHRDSAADPDLCADTVECAVDLRVPRNHNLDIAVQPDAIRSDVFGRQRHGPFPSILCLDVSRLGLQFRNAGERCVKELLIFVRSKAWTLVIDSLPDSWICDHDLLAITPANRLLKQAADDNHLALDSAQGSNFARSGPAEDTAIFTFDTDFLDVAARSRGPIGLSPFQIAFDVGRGDLVDGLFTEVAAEKASDLRRPEISMIGAAFFTFSFDLDLLDKFLGNVIEGVFNDAETVFQAIALLMPDFVCPPTGFRFVGCAERFSDLAAVHCVAHGPIRAVTLEKDEGVFGLFEALQHGNRVSNGVTTVGRPR